VGEPSFGERPSTHRNPLCHDHSRLRIARAISVPSIASTVHLFFFLGNASIETSATADEAPPVT
jgi:hypothetical protein